MSIEAVEIKVENVEKENGERNPNDFQHSLLNERKI